MVTAIVGKLRGNLPRFKVGECQRKLPGGGDHAERGGGGELARQTGKEAKAGGDSISGRQRSTCKALEERENSTFKEFIVILDG